MKPVVHAGMALFALAAASPALADKASWCEAYARDFADAHASEKTAWQHKHDIALSSCGGKVVIAQVVVTQTVAAPLAKPVARPSVTKTVKAIVKPDVTPQAAAETIAAVAPPQETKTLVAGSADWNAYCARKYTSFNAAKGTYLSMTGVARKCLVTAG